MATITSLSKQGCFDADLENAINTNFTNVNAALTTGTGLVLTSATGLPGSTGLVANSVGTGQLAAAAVTTTQLDPTTIQYATIPLANADILALHATPKVMVAAAGANTVIEVVSAVIEFVFAVAFTIGSAGNITINYKSDASGAATTVALAATGFLDQGTSQIRILKPITTNLDVTLLKNQGVYLTVATADVTGGAGSTGIVKVAYRVHSGL